MILTFTEGMYLGNGAKFFEKKKTTLAQLVGAINERLNAGSVCLLIWDGTSVNNCSMRYYVSNKEDEWT